MAHVINEMTGIDRVITLRKDAKYILRLKDDRILSQEVVDVFIFQFSELINGDRKIAVFDFDFELIQIVNE